MKHPATLCGCFVDDPPGNRWSDDTRIANALYLGIADVAPPSRTGTTVLGLVQLMEDISHEATRTKNDTKRLVPIEGLIIDGRYRLIRCLGTGGFASVWQAIHLVLQTKVALKLLTPDGRATAENLCQEAKHAAAIRHEHVVSVIDAAVLDQTAYVVMEYVQGIALSQFLLERKRIPWMDTCKLLRGVFLGLAAAQAVGVVHRDIKPANLLVEPSGLVKIVDFGLASVVRDRIDSTIYQSIVVGTPTYMAPEQAKDPDHCTWRVDAYAMGCVFYHCLVGHPPYQGGSAIETITMHAYHEVPLVSAAGIECPSKIVSLIADLMAKEPLSRPASYEEIIARIDRALSVRSSSFIRRLLPG